MLRRFLEGIFALSFLGLIATAALGQTADSSGAKPEPVFTANGLGKGAVALSAPWQFHTGDDMSWADPAMDDRAWQQIAPTQTWGMQGLAGYTGFAWYRLHIDIDLAPGASPEIALYVPPVEDAYEVYWNGAPVGHFGKLPPGPSWSYTSPPQTFGLGAAHTGVLAVRVWKAGLGSFDQDTLGGFTAAPQIGSPQAIGALKDTSTFRWLRSHQVLFGLDSLYALVAFLGMLGWFRDRSQQLLFWMAGFAGSVVLTDCLLRLGFPFPFTFALGFAQPLFGSISISTWFVLILLLDLGDNRPLMRTVRILACVMMACFVMDGALIFWTAQPLGPWVLPMQWADAILTAIFTCIQTVPLFLVAYAVLRRRRLSADRWIVAVCAFLADGLPTLRSALAQGNRFTHLTLSGKLIAPLFNVNGNPISAQTLSQAALLVALVYAAYRFTSVERRRQAAIAQEIKNAREIQRVLVPETLPSLPGFSITSAYRPAQEVGGDFFQIIPLASGSTLIILGDVSGKGLGAAMAVSLIVGATRMVAEFTSNPAEILAALNRRLHGRLQGGFATCIAMRLDADGSYTIASAGHPAPFLNDQELSLPGAFPLGLDPSTAYEESTLSLQPGDHFALYTDGLLEARNAAGELFSFERLKNLFATDPTAAEATDAAVAFGQDDDITVLTLTRLAVGSRPATKHVEALA